MIPQKGGEVMGTPGSLRAMPLWVKGGGGTVLFKQEASLKRGATVLLICGAHRQFFMG